VLVEAAMVRGRDLMQYVVSLVSPKTILAWEQNLKKQNGNFLIAGRTIQADQELILI
jgi:hypothetical protein